MRSVATFVGWAALLQTCAMAQDQPATKVEKIVVTGSRIPRPDASSASPIISFDADDIEAHGTVGLEDFLNMQPRVQPDVGKTINNGSDGSAHVSLRALGASRTLVLLNGRRLAPSGVGSAIDLNAIPAALIERIDIITGGESAVYGSDAVAGVVNLITRRNFEGLAVSWQSDIYSAGDGLVNNGNLAWGASALEGRAQFLAFANYLERDDVLRDDRDFTRRTIGDDKETGELFFDGSLITPSGVIFFPLGFINGTLVRPTFEPDGSLRAFVDPDDLYDFAPDNYLQTPLTRVTGGAFARLEVSPALEVSLELLYAQPRVDSRLAPVPAIASVLVPIDAAFFTDQSRQVLRESYDPDGDGIASFQIRRRLIEMDPRFIERTRDSYRGTAGLRGEVRGWTWDLAYTYARNETNTDLRNDASRSRLLQGILVDPLTGLCADPSGGCVPVNIFGAGALSAEAVDFIRIDSISEFTRVEQQVGTFYVSGDIFRLFDEMVSGSVGTEWRRVQTAYEPDPVLFTGDTLAFRPNQPVHGAFELREAFGELLVPLLTEVPFAKRVEIEAGVRFSEHSTAGSSWTWKYGGQWRPMDGLRLRVMAQRAVRAPNIRELFEARGLFEGLVDEGADFCAAVNDPVGRGLDDVCLAQGMAASQIGVFDPPFIYPYDSAFGGNTALQPETAETVTAGIEWEFGDPWRMRLSVDYFAVRLDGVIGRIDAFSECEIARDPSSAACQLITRDAEGFITSIADIPINLAYAEVEGIDLGLEFTSSVPDWAALAPDAKLSIDIYATHYLRSASTTSDFVPAFDCAGYFACGSFDLQGPTLPATTVISSLRYDAGPGSVLLRWRWIDGMDHALPAQADVFGLDPPVLAIPHIDPVNYVDVAAQYRLGEHLRLRAGVDNVFETEPPLLARDQTQSNTDPPRYDVFGRHFFFGIDISFEE